MEGDRKGRRRLRRAVIGSVLGHLVVATIIVFLVRLPVGPLPVLKKGEPMIVDLTDPNQPPPLGNPLSKEPGPPGPAVKAPAAPPGSRERPAPPPAPPRGQVAKAGPEKAPVPKAAPKPAPKPAPPEPSKLASTPPPAPTPPTPPPARDENPTREERQEAPAPKPPDAIAKAPEPAAEPARTAPSPGAEPSARQSTPPAQAPPSMRADLSPGTAGGTQPGRRPGIDGLAALRPRGGGAGGGGVPNGFFGARGGISGEPVALDSKDPRFGEYLERIRRAIQEKMTWPCDRNPVTFERDCKSAQLIIEFGILKDGNLQFLELHRSSGMAAYDESSANAIKLASPFPAIPPEIMRTRPADSTGLPIAAHFIYSIDVTYRGLLR
jgi:TonB C terminal